MILSATQSYLSMPQTGCIRWRYSCATRYSVSMTYASSAQPYRPAASTALHCWCMQVVQHGRTGHGPAEQDPAGADLPGAARCSASNRTSGRHQDRRVRRVHVPGVHSAAVQPGLQDLARHCHRQRHILPCGQSQLHLWAAGALHQHRHCLLKLAGRYSHGTQGELAA